MLNQKSSQAPPSTFILDGTRLQQARRAIAQGRDVYAADVAALRDNAEAALQAGPFSITSKKKLPTSNNPHDYFSQGPYWWPNSGTSDGLPYVRRDGETNPESNAADSDHSLLVRMTFAVMALAQAWYLSDNPAYAQHAARLVRTWFLEKATRMNPHLQYAQAIPGITDGRGIGIIDTAVWVRLIDALQLLKAAPCWSVTYQRQLQEWFAEYLHWMKTSANGQDEQQEFNNHGTWYDAQVIAFALFTEQDEIARQQIEQFCRARIASQIADDGSQPHELKRTKSWTYSTYNLHGFMSLARLGEQVGVDLWNEQSREGGSIRKAIEFLLPYAGAIEEWPYPQLNKGIWKTQQSKSVPCTLLVFGKLRFLQAFHEDVVATEPFAAHRRLFSAPFYVLYA